MIAGEVGDSKREIVFHGGPMNAASRIEQLTRPLDRR
ncbi:MAG: adenylate/guanylate cyclase domain-containing protein, partial [Candidatus Rokuibacteriota bacterium]